MLHADAITQRQISFIHPELHPTKISWAVANYILTMTTSTSQKQLTANRNNALLGGVKTPQGKTVSSKNAMKYGIFSKVVVLEEIEDEQLYEDMRSQFFGELQPVGIVETTLVDRLISLQWRLARITKAETAMVLKGRMDVRMKHALEETQHFLVHAERPSIDYVEHFRTSLVCKSLLASVDNFVTALDWFGLPLSPHFREQLEDRFGTTHDFSQIKHILDFDFIAQSRVKGMKLEAVLWKDRIEDPSLSEDDKQTLIDMTKIAREFAGYMLENAKVHLRVWEEMEMKRDWAEEDTRLVPPEKEMLAIHRGESNLHRMFMHSLHELQRLQSARQGNQPPLVAALDVNVSNENGFDL